MALAKAWELDFNSADHEANLELASKFYSMPDGFNGTPAHLRLGSDANGNYLTSTFGIPEAGAASFQTLEDMMVQGPADGDIAYCYDADPAWHGRFVGGGGDWGERAGDVRGAHWLDKNHNLRGILALWTTSFSAGAGDAVSIPENQGYPHTPDLRGGELRIRRRLRNFYKPDTARLVRHVQTHVAELDAEDWNPAIQQYWANLLQIADVVDNKCGFGTGGFYDRSPVTGVRDSRFQDIVIRQSTDDRFWMQLGGQEGRQGMEGEVVGFYNYGPAPAELVLGNWTGNMMDVGFYPTLDQATRNADIPVEQRMRGHMDTQKIEMWLPE
jgi:hypothetical protein